MRRVLTLAACLMASGCTVPFSIAAKTDDGHILRGIGVNLGPELLTFNLMDGPLSCAGNYHATGLKRTIEFPLACSDGRKGNASVRFALDGLHGAGRIIWDGGGMAELIVGDAKAFQ